MWDDRLLSFAWGNNMLQNNSYNVTINVYDVDLNWISQIMISTYYESRRVQGLRILIKIMAEIFHFITPT